MNILNKFQSQTFCFVSVIYSAFLPLFIVQIPLLFPIYLFKASPKQGKIEFNSKLCSLEPQDVNWLWMADEHISNNTAAAAAAADAAAQFEWWWWQLRTSPLSRLFIYYKMDENEPKKKDEQRPLVEASGNYFSARDTVMAAPHFLLFSFW